MRNGNGPSWSPKAGGSPASASIGYQPRGQWKWRTSRRGSGWSTGTMPNRSRISRSNRAAGNDSPARLGTWGRSGSSGTCSSTRRSGAMAVNRYTARSAPPPPPSPRTPRSSSLTPSPWCGPGRCPLSSCPAISATRNPASSSAAARPGSSSGVRVLAVRRCPTTSPAVEGSVVAGGAGVGVGGAGRGVVMMFLSGRRRPGAADGQGAAR